ncbi:hypothetical protein WMY93_020347 [Mugilogobius chulae]|uniref:Uncharacterized protein n=1 Tax=Mugilogobius chulae TaxID=88201 RepID=A0AAW0NU56_9GOBI
MGPPPTPVSRLQQRKTFGPSRNQSGASESGGHSETSDTAKTTQVSSGRRATPFKVPIIKPKLTTTPAKPSAPVLTTPCKSTAPTKSLTNNHVSPQKRQPPPPQNSSD